MGPACNILFDIDARKKQKLVSVFEILPIVCQESPKQKQPASMKTTAGTKPIRKICLFNKKLELWSYIKILRGSAKLARRVEMHCKWESDKLHRDIFVQVAEVAPRTDSLVVDISSLVLVDSAMQTKNMHCARMWNGLQSINLMRTCL